MYRNPSSCRRRLGLTLTELLVVVSILVILLAVLVPAVQPALRGQKVREASREINVYLTNAQARAVEAGRPFGVWLERAEHDPAQPGGYTVHRMFTAEQPAPYTGDTFQSRVWLEKNTVVGTPPRLEWYVYFDAPQRFDISLAHFVRPGDRIRFEGRGPWFEIDRTEFTRTPFRRLVISHGERDFDKRFLLDTWESPPPISTLPDKLLRFEVTRLPVKAAATPLELPNNTGIDLSLSGFTSLVPSVFLQQIGQPASLPSASFRDVRPEWDIVIMFSPEGGIDRIHYIPPDDQGGALVSTWIQPDNPVHLFIVRDDKIARDNQNNVELPNFTWEDNLRTYALGWQSLADPDGLWVSLGTDASRITVAPNNTRAFQNANYVAGVLDGAGMVNFNQAVNLARTFARSGRGMGGR